METIVLIVHVMVAAAVIGLVLIQQGKGAEAGASFGGGASQTVFGSQGTSSFLSKTTSVLALVFFLTSLGLALYARQRADVMSTDGIPSVITEPVAPVVKDKGNSDVPEAVQDYVKPQADDVPVDKISAKSGDEKKVVEKQEPVLKSQPVKGTGEK
ncbi:Protein-export membrane protein SecG [invertebrate metagenome]|uniref:Protein-export membrane protein SecG n=1 Tax=invertebrate metagenome TaxID=1711999 RepID=A0A2H9T8U5_9ZZZZ